MSTPLTPAEMLLGKTLDDDWKVIEKLPHLPTATGGVFSIGYIVQSLDGTKGFLKALDFTKAIGATNPAEAMKGVTDAFLFERDV